MVTGELAFTVGHKSHLMRLVGTDKVHQLVKRIALNVELTVGPLLHQLSQLDNIGCANVPLVRARVDGDALCASL